MFYNYDVPGVGPDETYLIGGDSGGPSFAVVNGKLAILGEHFSTYGTGGSDTVRRRTARKLRTARGGRSMAFCRPTSIRVDAMLPANQQLTTVVPEPGTALLLIAAVMMLWAAASRRGAAKRRV